MAALVFTFLCLAHCVQWGEQPDSASALCRSSQYSMVAGAGRENGMETPMHENPEWEKARQALASISKAGAAGSSAKASSNGPVASAQVRRLHSLGLLMRGFSGRDTLGILSYHWVRVL